MRTCCRLYGRVVTVVQVGSAISVVEGMNSGVEISVVTRAASFLPTLDSLNGMNEMVIGDIGFASRHLLHEVIPDLSVYWR